MNSLRFPSTVLAVSLYATGTLRADALLTSWYTADSGIYAQIYTTTAAQTAQTPVTTWSRGTTSQSLPTYAGVSEVDYSSSWVYIRTTGLAGHIMGPWYLDTGKTQLFQNLPCNTATIYRFPRTQTVPTTKSLTTGGAIGYFVNGVAFFDNRDSYSYSNANGEDATPNGTIGNGDGIWDRDALINESASFDNCLAHQAGDQYHYHVNAVALRYQLGDHVTYNSTANTYAESTATVTAHSPILAWAADGYPVYGPYGYSSAMDATSGVRRMVSGYVLRNGQYGTTNLNSTGRTTLPAWAATAQSRSTMLSSNQYGPNISTTYPLDHYLEDWDWLGELGYTAGPSTFDLDQYNGRFCVTPDFPGGTYAYFATIDSSGNPAFPYYIGRQFYGSPTGGTVTSITETVTKQFSGGPNIVEVASAPSVKSTNGNVTVLWSAVEGGSYTVQASSDLSTWTNLTASLTATTDSASYVESGAASTNTSRFYRMQRTSLATFDSNGFNYSSGGSTTNTSTAPGGSAAQGTTVTITITLPSSPPNPPIAILPTSITLAGTIFGTSISRPSSTTAQATFVIPASAPTGAQTIVVTFTSPAPTYTMTAAFTITASSNVATQSSVVTAATPSTLSAASPSVSGSGSSSSSSTSLSASSLAVTSSSSSQTPSSKSANTSSSNGTSAPVVNLSIGTVSPSNGNPGATVLLSVTLPKSSFPGTEAPLSLTVGASTAGHLQRNTPNRVTGILTLPKNTPAGPQNVAIRFPSVTYQLSNAFAIR